MLRTVLLAALLVASIALLVFQQSIRSALLPGRLVEVRLERDDAFLDEIGIPEALHVHVAPTGTGQHYAPPGLAMPADRVLLVSAPYSKNLRAVTAYGRSVAEPVGALVVGVEVPRHDEDHWGQHYYARHLIRDLTAEGLVAPDAKVVVTGFSGGGKVSLLQGALGGRDAWHAVLAAGVNDAVTPFTRAHADRTGGLDLPIVVFNGTDDPIVTSYTEEVMEDLREAGFHRARLVTYDGGHTLHARKVIPLLNELFAL